MNPIQSASDVSYWKPQFLSNVRIFHVACCSSVFTVHIRTPDLTQHRGHMTLFINPDFKSNFNSHVIQLPKISVSLSIMSHLFLQYVLSSINELMFCKGENQGTRRWNRLGHQLAGTVLLTLEDKLARSCIKQPFFSTFTVLSVSVMALASLFLRNLRWIILFKFSFEMENVLINSSL